MCGKTSQNKLAVKRLYAVICASCGSRQSSPCLACGALQSSAMQCLAPKALSAFSFSLPRPRACVHSQLRPGVPAGARAVACQAVAAPEAPAAFAKPSASYTTTSDKYAIIDVGGVQHLVEEGRWYTCNRLKAEPGDVVSFARVLALKSDDEFHVGQPYVDGVTVEAEIVEDLKGPKVTIYKMKPKKHTRKMVGHRQPLSKCATAAHPSRPRHMMNIGF
jgi:large subunit ribosomal protein L21